MQRKKVRVNQKKMKKKFSLKEEYRKSWNYIKETRNFIYAVVGIFILFSLVGYFIPAPDYLSEQILEFIEELLKKTQDMSHLELILYIFFNNLKSSFFGILFGILFGIFPIISTIANGYLIGFIGLISVKSGGAFILLRLIPHGIFELPAVFIALGMGLKLGTFIFQNNYKKSFRHYLINSTRVFLTIILPLLIIAAIIEGSLISLFK